MARPGAHVPLPSRRLLTLVPALAAQIWAVGPDGSGLRQLTSEASGVALAAHPAWSPDGTRLAFTGRNARGDFNIWTARADGGGLARLTNFSGPHYAMVPGFSADGRRLVFESNLAVPPAASTAADATEVRARARGAAAVALRCRGRGVCLPRARLPHPLPPRPSCAPPRRASCTRWTPPPAAAACG